MLLDGTSGDEVGRIEISIRLDAVDIHSVVDEDVRHIEKYYFDPFIEDSEEILKNLRKVEAFCDSKQSELHESQTKVDAIRTAERSVEVELARLREEKDRVKVVKPVIVD